MTINRFISVLFLIISLSFISPQPADAIATALLKTSGTNLEAPQGFSYTLSSNQLTLNWNAVAGAAGYTVMIGFNSGNYSQEYNAGNVTQAGPIDITGASGTYYLAIKSYDDLQTSGYSNEIIITIPQPASSLQAPKNYSYTLSNNQLTLSWDIVQGATGYKIGIGFQPGSYPNVYDVGNTINIGPFDVTGIQGPYYSAVKGYNSNDESGYSNGILLPLTAVGTSLSSQITSTVSGRVTDKNGVPISGVTISAFWTNVHTTAVTTTDLNGNYTLSGLGAGNSTDYEIRAEKPGFGFYPSIGDGIGEIIKEDYNGLYRTVIHFPSIPATYGLTGANFTAYRAGDKLVSLARTGQATSYLSGDDASAQKGTAWPSTRFMDNQNGTITDTLTGLIWLKNASCFAPGNWNAALIAANQLYSGSCGLSDGSTIGQWRMPNINELESLVDVSQSNPALSAGNPFTNVSASYWSSTTYTALYTQALGIRFTDGRYINGLNELFNNDKTTSSNALWAVKSGGAGAIKLSATGSYRIYAAGDDASHTCPLCTTVDTGGYFHHNDGDGASLVNSVPHTSPRFIDNGDGTLADTVTGLTWLKKADCIKASWSGAIMAANNLASGQCGLSDGSAAGQ